MMESQLFENVVSKAGCPPLVFKSIIDSWPASKWTPQSLATELKKKKFQCKVSPIDVEGVQWETESLHIEITLQQYADWLKGKSDQHNLLNNFDRDKFSCYIDYKYMKDFFKETPEYLKAVDWSVFGLDGRDGEDSTIWIGSTGAYTPCHYDTYGYNLVAQLCGRKRWYLFSPRHGRCLYPTRLPYEESSVFSEVNIRWPNLKKHRQLKDVEVFIVDLMPGDVLYVPRHWWHFVECLDSSVSVNTWIPVKEDNVSHFHEALSRCLFTCLSSVLPSNRMSETYINTNEELLPVSVNISYLNTALDNLQTHSNSSATSSHLSDNSKSCQSHSTPDKRDNFEKFCQAFVGTPVHYTITNCICSNKSLTTCGKRKAEPMVIESCVVPSKITKFADCDRENLLSASNDNRRCNVCCGLAIENKGKTKAEIYYCRKYSFQEYLSFLRENYDYDDDVVSDTGSLLCEDIGLETKTALCGSEDRTCKENVTLTDVINSVLQPEVIQHIGQVLKHRLQSNDI